MDACQFCQIPLSELQEPTTVIEEGPNGVLVARTLFTCLTCNQLNEEVDEVIELPLLDQQIG